MGSTRLIATPTLDESRSDAARILSLKHNLESPNKGVAAEALAELRALAPEALPELLNEKLKAGPRRFFLPLTARQVEVELGRRLELLRAVASQRAPDFVPVLAVIAGDREPIIRSAATSGLRDTLGEAARNALILLLEHRDWQVRQEAAAALASRKEPENLALFLRLLSHRNREIQRQAVLGLGQLDSKEAREALAERFRWAVDTRSPVITRWINVLLPVAVTGMGVWAHFDPSLEWTLPRLLVLLLAGIYVLARQRRRADRRNLAQSLAEQCKSEVPDEVVMLHPEMSAVQSGLWQSDSQTIAVLSQITRAAKEQIEDRGNLPVSASKTNDDNERNLPLISNPPST